MKKVLIFGTYPIVNPQHGGQHRVSALVKEYSKKFNTKYVALYQKNFYPDATAEDVAIPAPVGPQTLAQVYTSDVRAGKILLEDHALAERVNGIIQNFKPDVIQIEQAFPYFGLKELLKNMKWDGKLVYSSHNVEFALKKDIVAHPEIPRKIQNEIVSDIENMELDLVRNADLVIACTEADANFYKKNSANNVVVANNGISQRTHSEQAAANWKARLSKKGVSKPILYIGSAHPPNISGFEKMIGYGLGFLPPDSRLLLVGGVSDVIGQRLAEQPNYIQTAFHKRAQFLGRVSESDLAGLLAIADTIILPITEGGGSNLKTAEAILADAKVVGTTHAFRSYEQYMRLPNLFIADKKRDFIKALSDAVNTDKKARTNDETILARAVTWESVLVDVVTGVERL